LQSVAKAKRDCGCGCSLVTAELQGVKLDMTIMLNTIESKISTIESKMSAIANVARENEEIIKLKEDLLNERERYKQLEHNMLEVVREKTMKSKFEKYN
jgi:uncharacterized membrane protein